MRLIFARHGENQANVERIISNRSLPHGLTAKGRAQAETLAALLDENTVVAIYASPILRAQETASILSERLGLPVRTSDALREFDCGIAEGRGDGLLRIGLINLGINPLKVGDVFVTSGAGGYYRPGVAVAVLTETAPDGGIARLIAEPSATNYVVVEPIYEPSAVEASVVRARDQLTEEEVGD